MVWRASFSFAALRETMTTLAPLAASIFATERPIPSEAPVNKTVYHAVTWLAMGLHDQLV